MYFTMYKNGRIFYKKISFVYVTIVEIKQDKTGRLLRAFNDLEV